MKKEKEPVTHIPDVGFTLFVEPENVFDQHSHDDAWRSMISNTNPTGPLEIQYEHRFDTGHWKSMQDILSGVNADLSVHLPVLGRDIASDDNELRDWSIREYEMSMDLAHSLSSRIVILHLTPQDDFEDRDLQLERGFESFYRLSEYKQKRGYGFRVLMETLEYPKWPSDTTETNEVIKRAKSIDPNIGFCVDVAHLWHNAVALNPNDRSSVIFPSYLRAYLLYTDQHASVERIHFGGAYVEDGENERHETHSFPGLSPGDVLSEDTYLHFAEAPEGFVGEWMVIDPVLKVLSEFSQDKFKITGRKPDMVVEIHEEDLFYQQLAAKNIRKQMEIVSARK